VRLKEARCENPHPRIPGKPCNAPVRAWGTAGLIQVECYRCRGYIVLSFEEAESALTGMTV